MKIEKGILSDTGDRLSQSEPTKSPSGALPGGDVDKNRLFETLNHEAPSERNYLKLLGIVALVVIVIGAVVSYLMMPGIGDEIRVSTEVELAVRDHFLTKEKRDATDITFYQCNGYYGARVGVETRSDIPNPIYKIATYSARATNAGGAWTVTAQPISSPEMDVPCK